MISLLLTLALLGQPQPQQHATYHFRTLPLASGQYIPMQAPAPPSPATDAARDDPFGFTTWLNATRRMYGLGPLVYDHDLARWAALNNQSQRHHGQVGHYIMGPARWQCAAVITGPGGEYVGAGWIGSDEHRRALLSPEITRFGLAWDGLFFTWNAM